MLNMLLLMSMLALTMLNMLLLMSMLALTEGEDSVCINGYFREGYCNCCSATVALLWLL